MTLDASPASATSTDAVCPFLGMIDDPETHLAFPSSAQRCYASTRPFAVDSAKQGRDCLTDAHLSCSRYHPPTPVARVHPTPPVPADGQANPSAGTTRVTRATGGGRPARRLPRVPVAVRSGLLLLVLVVVCAVGLFIGSLMAGQAGNHPSAAPSGPAPSGVPGAVATLAPAATASPVASPSATPAPTPVPSVTPSAAPSPLVHTVRIGETLTSIAAHYGVTLAALEAANRITTPNIIHPGQKLIIPPR